MKALTDNYIYNHYQDVAKEFNNIISYYLQGYDGKKKEQFKSFCSDLQQGGCQSGMISDFIYSSDCKEFYIKHIDDLQSIKEDLEEEYGEPVQNRNNLPHYTFMCWLGFEEYVFSIGRDYFDM